jgi:hypothetical protein
MIKLENTEVVGWQAAIRGMRNSYNSWDKSDSGMCDDERVGRVDCTDCKYDSLMYCSSPIKNFIIGKNDLELMKKLSKAGTDHRKFMRMITVYVDVTAPMYFWKQIDQYKVGTVRNSCSTMHTITNKEFTLDDFSCEHLMSSSANNELCGFYVAQFDFAYPKNILKYTVKMLNICREKYLETKDKKYWYQIIQLLPSSYNQKSTLMLNYEVLANIYPSRKDHKLDEWKMFCEWIESLPYSEIITGKE